MDREQQLIEAAMRFQTLLDQGQIVNVREFVAGEPADLRAELTEYLELLLVTDQPSFSSDVTAEEQALIDRVAPRTRTRLQQRLATTAPAQSFTALRAARKLSPAKLAQHLNLPVDLVSRIERGGVIAATIPHKLIARLATVLEQTEAAVQAALNGPALVAPTRLSAQDATTTSAEEAVRFADALAASTATDAQKAEWQ